MKRFQRRQFLNYPWTLYRNDPHWIPPLRMNQREMVGYTAFPTYKKHPFYNDAEAPFDPDYLVGRWTFEYDTPESALGPGGQVTGTETVQHVDGCLYEGTTQAKGPTGAFTIKSTIVYDPSAHYMIVLERDSRGLEVLKSGRVGGDSGGFYTHHWQAAPLTVKRTKVRLKGTTFMASPVNFRVRTEISEGDDPFVNLGTVWVQRQGAPGGK
jgi:hypothetical protein